MLNLTNAELDAYKREAKYRQAVMAITMPVTTTDLIRLMAEVESSRILIERLAEKCSELREQYETATP